MNNAQLKLAAENARTSTENPTVKVHYMDLQRLLDERDLYKGRAEEIGQLDEVRARLAETRIESRHRYEEIQKTEVKLKEKTEALEWAQGMLKTANERIENLIIDINKLFDQNTIFLGWREESIRQRNNAVLRVKQLKEKVEELQGRVDFLEPELNHAEQEVVSLTQFHIEAVDRAMLLRKTLRSLFDNASKWGDDTAMQLINATLKETEDG